jgi:hypothetical protein
MTDEGCRTQRDSKRDILYIHVYMCKQPGRFINLVVNSTLCLPLDSVAPSDFTQFAITRFLQTKFSSFCYLF